MFEWKQIQLNDYYFDFKKKMVTSYQKELLLEYLPMYCIVIQTFILNRKNLYQKDFYQKIVVEDIHFRLYHSRLDQEIVLGKNLQ